MNLDKSLRRENKRKKESNGTKTRGWDNSKKEKKSVKKEWENARKKKEEMLNLGIDN